MHSSVVLSIAFSILGIAWIYFIVRTRVKLVFYFAAIFLCLGQILGPLFKVLHLPGGDILLVSGTAGSLLVAGILIRNALKDGSAQIQFYKLMAGLIILLQIGLVFFGNNFSNNVGPLLHYPLTAFLGTVLLNDQTENEGERNMILLFLLISIIYIALELLNGLGG